MRPGFVIAAGAAIMALVLSIRAYVSFIGHIQDGRLFCNAPCAVTRDGVEVYRSATAVDIPFDGDGDVRQVK